MNYSQELNQLLIKRIKELELENQIHQQEKEQLKSMAFYDLLTKLPNRFAFNEQIKVAMNSSLRNNQKLAVLFIDLNDFKFINDNYGHDIGDLLLIQVANCLLECTRNADIVARFGGDEFVVGLTSIQTRKDVQVVTDKILHALSKIQQINNAPCQIEASIGVCIFPDDSNNIIGLLHNSDQAMYKAKKSRDSRVIFYTH